MPHEDLIRQYNEAKYYIQLFEERAGILQYDAGYSKQEAERLARLEIRKLKNPEYYCTK